MNILDEEFAEFQKLPTEERIGCFEKNGHLFDMIRSQQLNREIINDIYRITNQQRSEVGGQVWILTVADRGFVERTKDEFRIRAGERSL
jgi:hypothetical protein